MGLFHSFTYYVLIHTHYYDTSAHSLLTFTSFHLNEDSFTNTHCTWDCPYFFYGTCIFVYLASYVPCLYLYIWQAMAWFPGIVVYLLGLYSFSMMLPGFFLDLVPWVPCTNYVAINYFILSLLLCVCWILFNFSRIDMFIMPHASLDSCVVI